MAEERSRYKGVFPDTVDLLEGSSVAVHVGSGDAGKVWTLPEKLLKSKSAFFTAALEGGFAEGISKSITLTEEDPRIFQILLGAFVAFGDRLLCPLMQDDAMCNLIAYYDAWYIGEVTLKQMYEGSTRGSKLRRWAVDQCLHDIKNSSATMDEDAWSNSRFVETNEDFAQQFAEATILLHNGKPNNPICDQRPYLFAPSTCPSEKKSGS